MTRHRPIVVDLGQKAYCKQAVILVALLLSGCAEFIGKAQTVTDRAGAVSFHGPCTATLGAWSRQGNSRKAVIREYVEEICPSKE